MLAISACSKGWGFALLERPDRLVDYGLIKVRPWSKQQVARKLADLLRKSQATTLAVRDLTGLPSGPRTLWTNREAVRVATAQAAKVRIIGSKELVAAFGTRTVRDLTVEVCNRYPELEPRNPPPRRPWMAQDERLHLFVATALADLLQERVMRPGPWS